MYTRHVAYGLGLRCSFALPGMPGSEAEASALPQLELELTSSAELKDAWSGASGPPEWSGRLGDGCTLTLERGRLGDHLFSYGDRAQFHLDGPCEHLACAPMRDDLHWRRALIGRVLPNVATLRGYEALHASAVESSAGVLAIAAPSGMGKTTLALEFIRRGWPLFADDVLVLGAGSQPGDVQAHPGTPHMNVALEPPAPATTQTLDRTLAVLAGERWIAVRDSARQPRPVRMVLLLERAPGLPLSIQRLPTSPLPLAPYMLGLAGDATRERKRFACYSDLMCTATLTRLTCDLAVAPAELADMVEQELAASDGRELAVGVGR